MSMFELTNTSQYSAQLLYPPFANLIGYLARSQQLPSEFWAELGLIATKALNKLRLDDVGVILLCVCLLPVCMD
jgi:hypothetical protein